MKQQLMKIVNILTCFEVFVRIILEKQWILLSFLTKTYLYYSTDLLYNYIQQMVTGSPVYMGECNFQDDKVWSEKNKRTLYHT